MTPDGFKATWMSGKGILKAAMEKISHGGTNSALLQKFLENKEFMPNMKIHWGMLGAKYGFTATDTNVEELAMIVMAASPELNVNLMGIIKYLAEHEGTNINNEIRDNAKTLIGAMDYLRKQQTGVNPATEKNRQQFDAWRISCIT